MNNTILHINGNMLNIAANQKIYTEQIPIHTPNAANRTKAPHAIIYTPILPVANFMVYPNPATTYITILNYIANAKDQCTVQISDALGKNVYSQKLAQGALKNTLDIQQLAAGQYVVNIYNNGVKVFTSKLSITK